MEARIAENNEKMSKEKKLRMIEDYSEKKRNNKRFRHLAY